MTNRRLSNFIEENHILNENQARFRKGYSTVDHIFIFTSLIDMFVKIVASYSVPLLTIKLFSAILQRSAQP